MVVVVEGESREQIVPALDDVCRELAQRKDLFGAVMHEPTPRNSGPRVCTIWRSTSPDPKEIDLAKIDALLDQAAPILQGDWSAIESGQHGALDGRGDQRRLRSAARASPRRHADRVAASDAEAAQRAALGRNTGELQVALARHAIVRIAGGPVGCDPSDFGRRADRLHPAAATRGRQSELRPKRQVDRGLAAVDRRGAESRHPGTKIGLTGLPIIEHDEMQSSEQSMSAATILSFVGVLAVIIVAFGGFRHAVVAMLALVVGMVWACGGVALTIGHVNVLSIAFGSILFGLGIDYGIYYVARYLQLRRDTESTAEALAATAASTGPGILTGAVTVGHRLLRRRFDGISRRGPTGRDRRRRRSALLACRGDRPAGDDPPGRCRRSDEELARAAESAVLAATAVRLSAADAAGGASLARS